MMHIFIHDGGSGQTMSFPVLDVRVRVNPVVLKYYLSYVAVSWPP